jgi:membrane-bound serine protease (ClpP class)
MMIVGGIYFEMQSPGIGFPLIAALTGAVLYFAPLYLEGLVQNWEIVLFIAGIILLAVEIFVTPGFGVAGIGGIICIVTGLAFAMVDNDLLVIEGTINFKPIIKPFAIVLVSITISLFGSIYLAAKLYGTRVFSSIALKTDLTQEEGFVGVEKESIQHLAGLVGVVTTDLKPSGTVEIDGKRYYAQINYGFAPKGTQVLVLKAEEGRLYCKKY